MIALFLLFAFNQSFAQTYKVEEVSYSFEIFEVKGLNSKFADFCPVIYNDQLVFTSGRESDLVLLGENNWKSTGYLNLFKADIKHGFGDTAVYKDVKLFSSDLSNNNHTGPLCFTITGDTVFFTQTIAFIKKKKEIRKPQLHMAVMKDGKWTDQKLLPFCDPNFSFGHPSWDPTTNTLYYASDVSGGKGGKDIYKVKLINGSWGTPENIEVVNTESNEMFPFISHHDLFFSSDREGGKGGLDLYWKILNYNKEVENLEALNTSGDDLGLFVSPDQTQGMYSVAATAGNDDIKYLKVERIVTVSNEFAGKFRYRKLNLDANDLKVQLYKDDDLIIEQLTDDKGEFKFRNLPYEHYTVKILSEEDLELIVYDKDGNPVAELIRDREGSFQYKKIDMEKAGTLSLIPEDMSDFELNRGNVSGQFVYENIPGEYPDSMQVMLMTEDGDLAFEQYTDKRGNFEFRNLSLDSNYVLTVRDQNEDLILLIFDKEGNVVAQLKNNENGQFVYKKIRPEYQNNLELLAENEDVFDLKTMTVTGNFQYKKLEGEFGEGLKVYIYSEDGILLDSTYTNAKGQFIFTQLDPDQSYLYKIDESDNRFDLDEFNLLVEDRYGNVLASMYRGKGGFFEYRQLDNVAGNNLNQLEENDGNFELDPVENHVNNNHNNVSVVSITGDATIFFDLNSSYPKSEDYRSLDGIIANLKSNSGKSVKIYAYADARSTEIYNQWLSERRGNRIKEYLIKNGISADRIAVTSYGESKLFNACGENCSEEDHAQNRRVIIDVE
ncbi:OmpA family protein [Paracrocinitomix mangrovi]|uniref:OmpA family protein n=1 Tax=Paracrocinitomix mangrovi TaxID=2862509 RepID=UPI001C8DB914|nr:OmpA family protein [Paracrocinitomix mangrovi]UKN03208.1 OmpA family protein [Paracrocinitomix mangrovi]